MKSENTLAPIKVPFVVVVDGREKAPFFFRGLHADARQGHAPLIVPTEWGHLQSGDYSIKGYESRIAIERKSLADLYSTLGQHRIRFEREIQRLAVMDSSLVIIESPWSRILSHPPARSRLLPKVVFRTSISWMIRYRVPWLPCEDRRMAEIFTFRWLERWWRDVVEN